MKTFEQAMERIHFVVYGENEKRLQVSQQDTLAITLDLHQLSKKDASRLICNVINIVDQPCKIDLIHGYHHGTVIKDYIQNDLHNRKIVQKKTFQKNPGHTMLLCSGY